MQLGPRQHKSRLPSTKRAVNRLERIDPYLRAQASAGRLPFGDLGVFGLVDAGRVWIAGESSDRWHAAAGGGLSLAWQHRRANTLSIALARSPERTAAYVRAGFMF